MPVSLPTSNEGPVGRIVSLLPSATEIICALGLRSHIVACTHECDFPPGISSLPHVTRSLLPPNLTCSEIDTAVSKALSADAHTIYALDNVLLKSLHPDAIVTQTLCDVCAVPESHVREVAACSLPSCSILSADPSCLEELFDSMTSVGRSLRAPQTASAVEELRGRLSIVKAKCHGRPKKRVAVLEWPDPPYAPGHWVPDQVEAAGGTCALGKSGTQSVRITWSDVLASKPDIIVAAFCGFDMKECQERLREVEGVPEWEQAKASTDIYACDASAYFSRPGPRLVDGVQLLAYVIHGQDVGVCKPVPGQFSRLEGNAWIDLSNDAPASTPGAVS